MSYMTLSSQEKPLFNTKFLDDSFFYSLRTFARIRQHYFSKFWGGPSPQSLLSLRPCSYCSVEDISLQSPQDKPQPEYHDSIHSRPICMSRAVVTVTAGS